MDFVSFAKFNIIGFSLQVASKAVSDYIWLICTSLNAPFLIHVNMKTKIFSIWRFENKWAKRAVEWEQAITTIDPKREKFQESQERGGFQEKKKKSQKNFKLLSIIFYFCISKYRVIVILEYSKWSGNYYSPST